MLRSGFYSHIAVPIYKPTFHLVVPTEQSLVDFTFDLENRFKNYSFEQSNQTYFFSQDDRGQWYFHTLFHCHSLQEVKLTRQIFRPTYLHDENLPLVELLKKIKITPIYEGFDKAYAHAMHYVPSLSTLSNSFLVRLANYDGPDDPVIVNKIHYIENIFKKQRTKYIAGFETRSFATVTENEYYAKEIHIPHNATNYLKLFIYFSRYGILPSHQMMPKFLGNLWASTQMLNSRANPALYKQEETNQDSNEK